jgi:hypothetical protein
MLLAGCGGAAGGGAACLAPVDAAPDPTAAGADSHLAIVNDGASLSGLVTCVEEPVAVEAKALGKGYDSYPDPEKSRLTLTLVSEVRPPAVVGTPRFVGSGPDDLAAGGTFEGDATVAFVVEIDGAGEPDTFRWSDDGGATWAAEGVAVGGEAQALSHGVTVTFGADTGHAAGDRWYLDAARLQATSVRMKGSEAVVSYAVAGAPHLGGILVFHKFTHDPVLTSGALFKDTDVHAVEVSNGIVYGAGAAEPGSFTDRAVLERIRLKGLYLEFDGYKRLGLPGFAATSVTRTGDTVYATSGTGGGLTAIADGDFSIETDVPLDDARWVDVEKKTVAVARGGSPGGTLSLLDGAQSDLPPIGDLPFDGADVPEAKTTVQLVGGKAYVAAGRAGLQVISLATGKVLAHLPAPTDTGLDPADVAANAVAEEGHLVFISFGGAGVYVAEAERPCTDPDDGKALALTILGRLRFGDFQSTNHVALHDGHLFVASGLGGLKIVRVAYTYGQK